MQHWILAAVAHLIHVYVVIVRGVVNGFEQTLELPRGSSVDHQDEGDSDRPRWKTLDRVLVPLDVSVGFTCEKRTDRVESVFM